MLEAAQSLRAGQVTHPALPYAFCVAITLGVSTEIYRRLHYPSGYWIPMTALLVLKPGLADTAARAIARTVGTLAGAILSSISLVHLPFTPDTLAVLALLFAWLSYATVNVNYGLFSVCLTAYIVFLLSLNGGPGKEVAEHRAIATAIGGGLALAVSLVVIRIRFLNTRKQQAAAGLSQAQSQSETGSAVQAYSHLNMQRILEQYILDAYFPERRVVSAPEPALAY